MKTNHGGIWVFIRSDLQVKIINFTSYESFEQLSLFVRIGAISFVLVVVYRPNPASAVTDHFFNDWADVLERTLAFASCLILGHINLQVVDTISTSIARFRSSLDSFGLRDHVGQLTRGDHQLDIFVSWSDQPAPDIWVYRPLLSDHSLWFPKNSLIVGWLQRRPQSVDDGARSISMRSSPTGEYQSWSQIYRPPSLSRSTATTRFLRFYLISTHRFIISTSRLAHWLRGSM
jgi:hypothetical protein